MKIENLVLRLLIFALAVLFRPIPVYSASNIVIKLGSLAPENTPFYDVIYQISNAWKDASDGKVRLKIYAGGVAGSETDMVRKMRIGQLHASSMSAIGISLIDPAYSALQMPALINSREELEQYRGQLLPLIEKRLADKGYVTMAHCDMGPLYFFITKKITSIEELKRLKVCTFSSNKESKRIWTQAGFTVIDLNTSEVLAGLQTGMIEGFIHSPLFALSMQWFSKAKFMVKVNYGFVLAATVINKRQWNKIAPELQVKLIEIAEKENAKLMPKVKQLNDNAIPVMVEHGLEIINPAQKDLSNWLKALREVHLATRGQFIPTDVYDKLMSVKESLTRNSPE